MPSNFEKFTAENLKRINDCLETIVPASTAPHKVLYEAARYSLQTPGKRIRPLLTLATAQSIGGNVEDALVPACVVELIHTYSLIHDDLPCMDNDDFRRGKPTLHKVYPEGIAVLAGDFLLTHAFGILAEIPTLSLQQKLDLISTLVRNAGGEGMIGGQILDLESEDKSIDLESLQRIHQMKTGNLMAVAIEFGAITAGASHEVRKGLAQFGEEIGLAFQMIDDVLDVTQSKMKHGKTKSSDLSNQKSTYVKLLGINATEKKAKALIERAKQRLSSLSLDTQLLDAFADQILIPTKIFTTDNTEKNQRIKESFS